MRVEGRYRPTYTLPANAGQAPNDREDADGLSQMDDCSSKHFNEILTMTSFIWNVDMSLQKLGGVSERILTGSASEGTWTALTRGNNLPLEDRDSLIIKGKISLGDIHTSTTHDGFLNIFDTQNLYKGTYIRKDDVIYNKEDIIYLGDEIEGLRSGFHGNPNYALAGPSLSETWRSDNVSFSYDNVAAFECKTGWPAEAENWKRRCRSSGWPSKALVDHITGQGFHVVPVSHPQSANPDIEWRFSFSLAEKALLPGLSKWQRNCFMLAKIICKKAFEGYKLICSYHIKTVFMWMLEVYDEKHFTEDNLGAMVILLIDRLILSFSKRRMPSYFIESYNLIDCMSRMHVAACVRVLLKVRRKPLYYLMEVLKQHFVIRGKGNIYEYLKIPTKCFTVMNKSELYCRMLRGIAYDLRHRIKCHQQLIDPLTYRPYIEIMFKMTQVRYEAIGHRWEYPKLLTEECSTEIERDAFQHDLTMCLSSMYLALGSHYRVQFLNATGSEKQSLQIHTKKLFEAALVDVSEAYDSMYVEYAAFCMDCYDYEHAKNLIGIARQFKHEVYNHYIPCHGYYRVKSLYFLLWLEAQLPTSDVNNLLDQYKKNLKHDGINVDTNLSCEMTQSKEMISLLKALEKRGKELKSELLPQVTALKRLVMDHHKEKARLIYWILKDQVKDTEGSANVECSSV